MSINNKIKKIINAIKDTEINDIEISSFWGFQKIKLSKGKNYSEKGLITNDSNVKDDKNLNVDISNLESQNPTKESPKPQKENNIVIDEDLLTTIKAPLVGTFYASSKPGEPAFVKVGDLISSGESICIIEAMKIFNEIESEFSGKIVEVLILDGEPVEYGQPLFTIKED